MNHKSVHLCKYWIKIFVNDELWTDVQLMIVIGMNTIVDAPIQFRVQYMYVLDQIIGLWPIWWTIWIYQLSVSIHFKVEMGIEEYH